MALPPARRICTPTSVARGASVTTIALLAVATRVMSRCGQVAGAVDAAFGADEQAASTRVASHSTCFMNHLGTGPSGRQSVSLELAGTHNKRTPPGHQR